MVEMLENLKIERVSSKDEQKVLAIRNPEEIYEGTDYLPSLFRRLLSFPNSTGYAVSYRGEWIAFTLVSIVDGGETAVFRSGRISKKYESQGIAKWQLTKLTEHLRKMREVRFIDTTTTREDTRAIQRHLEGKCYTVAHRELDDFMTIAGKQEIQPRIHCISSSDISIVDMDMMSKIFDRKDWIGKIFGKRLVVNWVPFRPIKSNIAYILQETTAVIGSNLHDVDRLLITFENQYEAVAGIVVFIDVYGNVSENLQNHIQQHMKHVMKSQTRRTIIARLFYDLNMNINFIEKVMNSCGFLKRRLEELATSSWVLESKL